LISATDAFLCADFERLGKRGIFDRPQGGSTSLSLTMSVYRSQALKMNGDSEIAEKVVSISD
jgi:hypothetical protein